MPSAHTILLAEPMYFHAALSVTAPHTIHPGIERDSLRDFANRHQALLTEAVQSLLEAD